ncbi:hypothetical protein FEM48_Zijuj05G0181200 [Ziziphus jujuba var. spinosa]|uniref:Uncharacterized protein n=1 Tax=Ziziphus jujuba var. spinosa TaxID=714518 RepID=A0A978VGC1_ZIZJJ|nr:hypothetical protein FEM48_Zijuj05G0181200 [Ziziphus jujuba var. spinosa]
MQTINAQLLKPYRQHRAKLEDSYKVGFVNCFLVSVIAVLISSNMPIIPMSMFLFLYSNENRERKSSLNRIYLDLPISVFLRIHNDFEQIESQFMSELLGLSRL